MPQLKRRKQDRTNYLKRLKLLKSGKTRIVVRKSSKNLIIQFVNYHEDGDKIILTVSTRQLMKLGYKQSRSNIPAAYLLGMLAGKKAKEKNIKEGILDIGLYEPIQKSRLYATVKGLVDAGFDIPHNPEAFPSTERLIGKHTKNPSETEKEVNEIKNKILKK
ncbi:MAG: 50S ribosomal protein L18 [Candidatus Nanoarchaeia archaeon]|nr:50S ribosomal protein L18 [Candidatus Nanoarchaeia archaeon]